MRKELEHIREVTEGVGVEWFTGYRNEDGTFIKHGPYRFTTDDERLLEEGELSQGFRNGKWKSYHENGRLACESEYRNGELHGRQTCWYDDGVVESETDFEENLNHGILRNYYRNGQLKEESHYLDGEQSGLCTVFNEQGRQIAKGTYVSDQPHEGTFLLCDEVTPSEALPDFEDYVDAVLKRKSGVVTFRDGRQVD